MDVPEAAQDRRLRGPLSALLILLSLVLGSASAAAEAGIRDPLTRLGSVRTAGGTSLLRAPDDDGGAPQAPARDTNSFAPPAPPRVVAERLSITPETHRAASASDPASQRSPASYRARAPPAA